MKPHRNNIERAGSKIRIENPIIRNSEEEALWREIGKFAKIIPAEVEPNMDRVREIKEDLKKGNYLSSEVIEETAARLAIRFMKME